MFPWNSSVPTSSTTNRRNPSRPGISASELLERCSDLESALKTKDEEIKRLRKRQDRLRRERDLLKYKLGQRATVRDTVVANAPPTPIDLPMCRKSRTPKAPATQVPPTYKEEYDAHSQSFETYMTRVDVRTGAQVLQAVQDLNAEIEQFSSSLAGELQNETTRITSRSNFEEPIKTLLSPRGSKISLTRVELAIQAALCTIVTRELPRFCVGLDTRSDRIIKELYTRICSSEPTAASSRWRSLTHKYLNDLYPEIEEEAIDTLFKEAQTFLWKILAFFGSPTLGDKSKQIYMGDNLRRIISSALKIARDTKQLVLSSNFEMIIVKPGRRFEKTEMENITRKEVRGRQNVLCTTKVGLRDLTRGNLLEWPVVILESCDLEEF